MRAISLDRPDRELCVLRAASSSSSRARGASRLQASILVRCHPKAVTKHATEVGRVRETRLERNVGDTQTRIDIGESFTTVRKTALSNPPGGSVATLSEQQVQVTDGDAQSGRD